MNFVRGPARLAWALSLHQRAINEGGKFVPNSTRRGDADVYVLSHGDDHHVLFRIHPEIRRGVTCPGVGTHRAHVARRGWILHDGESESESHSGELADRAEVITRHVLNGLRAQNPHA